MLEGSVRKTGAWLHINAQLIDARTDSHIWAEEYDRDLKDMFAIQSEIAQKVAGQLHAKIHLLKNWPLSAHQLPISPPSIFTAAPKISFWPGASARLTAANLLQAADLLNQAVAHDPTFFQAVLPARWVHDQLYHLSFRSYA